MASLHLSSWSCLLLCACSSSNLILQGDSAEETALTDSQGSQDSDDPDPQDDTATEQIPDNEVETWSTPAMCHVSMDCSQDIPDSSKVPCELRVESDAGQLLYGGWAGVELRGRSSSSFAKHQYAVELWSDASGAETINADFYEMGGESDWILGGNYADRALFRNKLSYDLFQSFGGTERYAAENVFCDLVLNGSWLGVYTWGERAKRDDDRVTISDRDDGESFMVKNDDSGGFMSSTDFYGVWQLVWPPENEASAAAIANIQAQLTAFQAAVSTGDEDAIWALADLDSAVDFVILHEMSRNNDAYFLSVHAWKDEGGLIHFMPWDLDLAWGGYPNTSCDWDAWVSYRSPAIGAFASSPRFKERLSERWRELRAAQLATDQIVARMDRYVEVMGDSLEVNFEVWTFDEIDFCFSNQCWLCPVESWQAEQEGIRQWTTDHLAWMDENIEGY